MLDVAIVGYGPVGALLARLLGRQGLAVRVLERAAAPYPLPRAVHFDGEVMRIFQSAGVADAMSAVTRASSHGMHFVNAEGRTLMIRRGNDGPGPQGWYHSNYFHQPDLERVLREAAESCPSVQTSFGSEVTDIEEAGDHARVTLASGGSLQARYVVGCDGARSLVRRLIGAEYEDLGLRQPWLVTDLVMHPGRAEALRLPNYTVQHCDPRRPMTACCVTGNRRRWEMMLLPGDDPVEIAKPGVAWKHLSRWVTPADAELERTAVYTFQSVIADRWRRGRLLIAGDAAHQTPPFIGQGMCAGIRDCANLAWKLERVLRGRSGDGLLDTYETERKPNVHAFIDLAVRVGEVIQADGDAAVARDRRFAEGAPEVFDFPPSRLGAGAHDPVLPAGELFPQPRLADGRLMDEAIGNRFAVLGSRHVIDQARPASESAWRAMDTMEITGEPQVEHWLAERKLAAVILRPDRHIAGVAADAASLIALSQRLPSLCVSVAAH